MLEYIATGKVAKGNKFIKRLDKAVKAANGQKEVRSETMISDFRMQDYAAHCLRERDAEYAKVEAARLAQLQDVLQRLANEGKIDQEVKEAVLNSQTDVKVLQEA